MVSTVPERVIVCVGSVRVCAQLGIERAKTTNPAALRIAFTRFMHLSLCCRIDLFGGGNFLTGARLNRRFLRRLCKNWKNFTGRRSAFLECAEEWSMVSRQMSPDISRRSAPTARIRNDGRLLRR